MMNRIMFRGGKSGFTLIELLVVIAIIGILATIVLASLNSARERSRDAKRVADLRNLQTALELYFDDNTRYPADLATLQSDDLIPAVPVDPINSGTNVYTYTLDTSDNLDYLLSVPLENGDHSALDTDLDGTILTIDCEDSVYCLQP